VESGEQRILDLINKGVTLKKIRRAINLTKKAGIKTIVYFMIGHPTETNEDVQATERLIEELDADRTLLNLVTPLPGTPIYQDTSRDWWRYYFQGKSFDPISKIDKIDIVFRRMSEEVAERNGRIT
jgi:anaerobic magnesium-protoporphyrin IX monomethyl ester cyclase